MPDTILVIPGFLAPRISEIVFYGALMETLKANHQRVVFENIPFLGFGNLEHEAAIIAKRHMRGTEGNFKIVTHSLGSVVAMKLAEWYPKRVKLIVALAPPYDGTIWADPFGAAARMLRIPIPKINLPFQVAQVLKPHSQILAEMRAFLADAEHYTVTAVGNNDRTVWPLTSAFLEGPRILNHLAGPADWHETRAGLVIPNRATNIITRCDIHHRNIVTDEGVLEFVIDALRVHGH